MLVTERSTTALRWAGNSMTTNGDSFGRDTTVVSIRRSGDEAFVGSVQSSEVDPTAITALVAASQRAAASAPAARDAAPPLAATTVPGLGRPDTDHGCRRVRKRRNQSRAGFSGTDTLYGFARHELDTTFVATSNGLRRRYTQPTGTVEINAKRDGASAWAGSAAPTSSTCPPIRCSRICRRGSTGLGVRSSCRRVATRR